MSKIQCTSSYSMFFNRQSTLQQLSFRTTYGHGGTMLTRKHALFMTTTLLLNVSTLSVNSIVAALFALGLLILTVVVFRQHSRRS